MIKRVSFLFCLLSFLLSSVALAGGAGGIGKNDTTQDVRTIKNIIVSGNQRIAAETVISYAGIEVGGFYSDEIFSRIVKDLFKTGFFSDVIVTANPETDVVVISLEENPIINQIVFEGNDAISTENLEGEVRLRPREVYTRTKVQQATDRLLEIYRRSGRFSAKIVPKIILRADNRVDLVFEVNEGEVTRVSEILFIGNRDFSDSTLKGEILTREARWYRFFTSDDTYDPDRVAFDKELLRRFYLRNGYIDFTVVSDLGELTPDKESFILTYTLREGKRYRFGKAQVISQLEELAEVDFSDAIEQEEGDWYSSDDVDATVDSLTDIVGQRGYAFVSVQPRIERDVDNRIVDVNYYLQEGEKIFIERINISGNKRTLDEVVRRELSVVEGDAFNTDLIRRSREDVNRLGLFSSVDVRNRPGVSPDGTVLDVGVKETATGELSVGAGFSTTDGAIGNLRIRERNFLGKNQDLLFSFNLSTRRQDFDMSFTEPYLFDRKISGGIDLYRLRRDYESEAGYISTTLGTGFRFGYQIFPRLTQSWQYRITSSRIDESSTASPFLSSEDGSISALTQSLTYDDRNSAFNPTEGFYINSNTTYAGLGGTFAYWQFTGRIAYYYPFAPGWIGRFQIHAGHIRGARGKRVRTTNRFFVGGDDFRGFEFYGLGPRDRLTDDSLGGETYYVLQYEQGFPIGLPEELGIEGRAFIDFGSLFGVDYDFDALLDAEDARNRARRLPPNTMSREQRRMRLAQRLDVDKTPRISIGAGFAWSSPFGPVRIYFGFPIKKQPYDQRETLRFTFGTRF